MLPLALMAVLFAAAPAAAAVPPAKPKPSWARAQIRVVVERGLMAPDEASFRADDPLAQGELEELVAGLTGKSASVPRNPTAPVTTAGLDARLVRTLGLADAAAAFARGARAAGLAPPSRFGTEVVARLLGLRINHPAALDAIEPLPADPASRAEAAYSTAVLLRLTPEHLEGVRAAAAVFALPPLTTWQQRVLQSAVSLVGFPYVWGGESERPDSPFGLQAQGGFDCSGFVWRVYKLQAYPDATGLADTLRGRTTYAMSGEIPKLARIPLMALAPGDVVFFGAKGTKSKPAQVDHMGIYAGGGWLLHSSRFGVALTPLAGWYLDRFAWARRPLAEAGLEPATVTFTS